MSAYRILKKDGTSYVKVIHLGKHYAHLANHNVARSEATVFDESLLQALENVIGPLRMPAGRRHYQYNLEPAAS